MPVHAQQEGSCYDDITPTRSLDNALGYAKDHGWRVELLGPRAGYSAGSYSPRDDPDCRCSEFYIHVVSGRPRAHNNRSQRFGRMVDGCIRQLGAFQQVCLMTD